MEETLKKEISNLQERLNENEELQKTLEIKLKEMKLKNKDLSLEVR